MAETFDRLPDYPTGTWVVTTENGTRAFLDFDDYLWRREPMARPDGRINWLDDGRWSVLNVGPLLDGGLRSGVVVGHRIVYGRSIKESIQSTLVTTIARCADADAPPPNPPRVTQHPYGDRGWAAYLGDVLLNSDGTTRRDALRCLGEAIDGWLDEQVRTGTSTRSARWWAARSDKTGSVIEYVRGAAQTVH